MNVVELRNAIIAKNIPALVIFTGDEVGVQDVYLRQMAAAKGLKIKTIETLADLWKQKINSRISVPALNVVRNDEGVLKDEEAWKCIGALRGMGGNTVLKFQKVDKRLKFGKTFADIIVDFEKLSAEQLARYIVADLKCTQERAVRLASYCGRDYLRALLECDKIKRFGKISGITSPDKMFDLAVGEGVVSKDIQAGIFEFVDLVVRKDKRCLELYKKLVRQGEASVMSLSLIFAAFKNVLVAQTDSGGKGVQERTGLMPFLFYKAKENSGHFSNKEIEKLLSFIKDVEQGVKLGKLEEEEAVPYALARILC